MAADVGVCLYCLLNRWMNRWGIGKMDVNGSEAKRRRVGKD